MFGPKHTAESVTRELIGGLNDGSIVINTETTSENEAEELRSWLRSKITEFRLLAAGWVVIILVCLVVIYMIWIKFPQDGPIGKLLLLLASFF